MPSKAHIGKSTGLSRPRLFALISLLFLLPLSLIACQSTASPAIQPTSTPTVPTIHLPALPTTCPSAGTARAAVTAPLALGHHPTLVYAINTITTAGPTFSAIDRLDLTTSTKTEILRLPSMSISDPQLSADGQWLLFISSSANGLSKLQMLRMDGEGLQTLYCTRSPKAANPSSSMNYIQWSPTANESPSAHSTTTPMVVTPITSGYSTPPMGSYSASSRSRAATPRPFPSGGSTIPTSTSCLPSLTARPTSFIYSIPAREPTRQLSIIGTHRMRMMALLEIDLKCPCVRPYHTRSSMASRRMVGAGLAPALEDQPPIFGGTHVCPLLAHLSYIWYA